MIVEPLTRKAFRPFGTVLEMDGVERRLINNGTTERFHALATVDVETERGKTIISLFRGQPRPFPYQVGMMEYHPLGSQAFYPLQDHHWLVIVAEDENGRPGHPRVFLASGRQGVQYDRHVWHHPLVALDAVSNFLIIDREGPGNNLVEADYPEPFLIEAARITDR
ncbi:MAG TPA: ureidoglycolate lyase [Pararhizobium sp.]|nr:ureidoglycolate lyase [Pararhizobium sp.]